ncbi:MAG: nucleotidyltransferase family protein [Nitrospinota bacterium]
MKGMILAAGLGERLRPETLKKPKPLFAIGSTNMLRNAIGYLAKNGLREIAVNAHHLAQMIKDEIDSIEKSDVVLHFIEEKEIMGTAGGIKGAERFIAGSEFVVLNSDTLLDLDLKEAVEFHRSKNALATLVVRDNPEPEKFGTLEVGSDGRLLRFLAHFAPDFPRKKSKRLIKMFTGLQIFSPEIFTHIPSGRPVDISTEVYPKLVESGAPVFTFDYGGYWADIGSREAYKAALRDIEENKFRVYEL